MYTRTGALIRTLCFVMPAALTGACELNSDPLPIVGTLERDRLELVAEARERIVEVLVTEGDTVEEGQILMELDQSLYESDLAQMRARGNRTKQELAELIRGPRSQQVQSARAELDARVNELNSQRLEHARVEILVQRKIIPEVDFDRIDGIVKVAVANVEVAEARLADLIDGTTREELAQARASVAEAEAGVSRVQLLAERLVIRAPRTGTIDAIPYKLGERPPEGATVIVMLAAGEPYARVYVPEPLRIKVTPGLKAEVIVDGIDDSFLGSVRYVSSDPLFTPYFALTQRDRSRLSYVAEITLTEPRARDLPAGIPVEVDFPSLRPVPGTGS
jgi:HlyD family secretion protein